eukprot:jgi/Orpsp1_1/1178981/evm.model.c7180000067457.3
MIINIYIERCISIELKAIAFEYSEYPYYTTIVNKFNEYVKNKNIDLKLNIVLYTSHNSTLFVGDYAMTIESILSKGLEKYDIYLYDNMYTSRFSPYFIDLKEWLPESHLFMYSSGIASQSCTYKEKWFGLPMSIEYSVLYSNMYLLNKYGKTIPKTWDELIETGKYILQNENSNGNYDIIGYNGLFPDYETALMSAIEFIYSFRKTKNSPFPKYTDQEAIDALNKIREVKNLLSSEKVFKDKEGDTFTRLVNGNAIFIKYWNSDFSNPIYNKTPLVGNTEGISASALGGSNIGI